MGYATRLAGVETAAWDLRRVSASAPSPARRADTRGQERSHADTKVGTKVAQRVRSAIGGISHGLPRATAGCKADARLGSPESGNHEVDQDASPHGPRMLCKGRVPHDHKQRLEFPADS